MDLPNFPTKEDLLNIDLQDKESVRNFLRFSTDMFKTKLCTAYRLGEFYHKDPTWTRENTPNFQLETYLQYEELYKLTLQYNISNTQYGEMVEGLTDIWDDPVSDMIKYIKALVQES